MRQKPGTRKSHGEKIVKNIRRATRKEFGLVPTSINRNCFLLLHSFKAISSILGRIVGSEQYHPYEIKKTGETA
ncbi:MAG: hypothetical protein ACR2O1_15160 [Boseongicola sp.]